MKCHLGDVMRYHMMGLPVFQLQDRDPSSHIAGNGLEDASC